MKNLWMNFWDWLCVSYIYRREVIRAKMEDLIQEHQDSLNGPSSQ